ncbi:hypothetical protein Y032_0383g386 [Ancylostoma ceylanicum]|nr:hypothetical protein Y032_0383g386 [Ancylostoma ceylanicum]
MNSTEVVASHNGEDYNQLTSAQLISAIMARNSDPIINDMLLALSEKVKVECLSMIETEKRGRSIVLAGLEEAPVDVGPSMRMKDLETKVEGVLSALQIECRPSELYRMGKFDPNRPRLVKIVFPSKHYWSLALANARLLKPAGYPDLFIRRSMTESERQKDYEMRKLAREKNKERGFKEWVVYRGELRRIAELNKVYRPPNSQKNDDDDLLNYLACICSTTDPLIIIGDFNIDVNLRDHRPNTASRRFMNFFKCIGVQQYVQAPTRDQSILDLVFSSIPLAEKVRHLPPLGTSDHDVLFFKVNVEISEKVPLPLPDYTKTDFVGLNRYLHTIDWWDVFDNYISIDDIYRRFCNVLYEGLAKFVPFTVRNCSAMIEYPPHIKALLAQKRRIFEMYPNSTATSIYKKVCADIDFHVRKFLSNRERRYARASHLKPLYAYMRKISRIGGKLQTLIDENGDSYVTDQQKANALAKYFSTVFSSDDVPPEPLSNNSHFGDGLGSSLYVYPNQVLKYLRALKPSTSETFDGIPQIVYRRCAKTLCRPLCHVFNISLFYGEVPLIWKKAIITAIPKKMNAHLLADFRPISINPPPIKILEKLIRSHLLSRLDKCNLIPQEQHGFLSGASTATLLTDSLHDWVSAVGNGKSIDIVYFDLSKAFDKVNHRLLLLKLKTLGVDYSLLKWFECYLKNRHMTVKVSNSFSETYECPSGVPQGGVLSPLLFLIYTMDLPSLLKVSPLIRVQIYADDIKIYAPYDEASADSAHSALSRSIEAMLHWSQEHGLPVNLNKTAILHLGKLPYKDYSLNGTIINRKHEVKDLGVLIDSKLSFSNHINYMVDKARRMLFLIFRNIHCNDPKILIRLYMSYVLPHLEYCSQIWNPYLMKQILKIESVQQTFTRILHYKSLHSEHSLETMMSYKERLSKLRLDSLQKRRVFRDLVFAFRILKLETRLRPSKYWIFRPSYGRTNRLALDPRINASKYSSISFNSFFLRISRWFRKLPVNLQKSTNLFRITLRKIDLLNTLGLSKH